MSTLLDDVREYVKEHIGDFHERRLSSLRQLRLKKLLQRKNPYLFKAKNVLTAEELVRSLLDAHLSSQEEAIFGNFLERIAEFVAKREFGGHKSPTDGIDIEMVRDDTLYLISVKSGPNWGNSQQVAKLRLTFQQALRRAKTSGSTQKVECINGCCYGQADQLDSTNAFRKIAGQQFWELVSGNSRLYIEIIEPLGYDAAIHNEKFRAEYAKVINRFTQDLLDEFSRNGEIDWERLLEFNSKKILKKQLGKDKGPK